MGKKITKNHRKQKPRMIEQPPPKLPGNETSVSRAILKLCNPLLTQYSNEHDSKVIIFMAVTAWNISLYPKEEQAIIQEKLIDALPEDMRAEIVAYFLEQIDNLIDRKNRDYPHLKEYIQDYQVVSSGDTIALNIVKSDIPDLIHV
jgi:hypothetical protein